MTFKRTYGVTPALNLQFAEVSTQLSSGREWLRYEPRLSVAGLLTSAPTWTFAALDPSGLVGSAELFLLAKKPKGVALEARFRVGAEVTTRLGPIRLRRYRDPELVNQRHPLAP